MSSIQPPHHSLIQPLKMSMEITRNIYERSSEYQVIKVAQKIATYTILPIAIVAAFEMLVKNILILNTINCGITLLNQIYQRFFEEKEVTFEAVKPVEL